MRSPPARWTCRVGNPAPFIFAASSTYTIRVCICVVDILNFRMYTCWHRRVEDLHCASRYRPIAAGGLVKSGPTVIQNVPERIGLTHRRHIAETPAMLFIVAAEGSSGPTARTLHQRDLRQLDTLAADLCIACPAFGRRAVFSIDIGENAQSPIVPRSGPWKFCSSHHWDGYSAAPPDLSQRMRGSAMRITSSRSLP